MPNLTGNRGEWSEVYTLLRLLDIGKLYAADENLNRIPDVFYDVLKILRTETHDLEFRIDKDTESVCVYDCSIGQELLTLPCEQFKTEADKLFETIKQADTPAFEIPSAEEFINNIGVFSLKAKSSDKADIRIQIHDINTGFDAVQGFSIKSRLGSPSTLINASSATNFVFEVCGPMDEGKAQHFNDNNKHFQESIKWLYDSGCQLKFTKVDNNVFNNNLMLIDSLLPAMISSCLMSYYTSSKSSSNDILSIVTEQNPLGYDLSGHHPFYHYKFKKLLSECALGMIPSKVWSGYADATGGYIVVREDGEVLCYHLFNRNEFENYLLNNTKFETGSKKKHGFGNIYRDGERYYIKLNLQVRFIK